MGSNPTLSAIPGPLNLLLRILWRPDEGWDAVRALDPGWLRSLLVVVPLAVLPALTASFALTFAFSVATVVIAAGACVLCSIGLRRLLRCRGEDAAMYVAAVGFVSGIAGLILGGLSGAAGIL